MWRWPVSTGWVRGLELSTSPSRITNARCEAWGRTRSRKVLDLQWLHNGTYNPLSIPMVPTSLETAHLIQHYSLHYLIIMSWTIKQQMDNTWNISCSNDNFLEQHLVWNKRINKLWISVPLREVREWTSLLTESNFCKALNRRGSDCLVPSLAELAVDLPIGTEILRETNCCTRGAQLKFHGGPPIFSANPRGKTDFFFTIQRVCLSKQ